MSLKKPYSGKMLSGVDYSSLSQGLFCSITDLEFETMRNMCGFVEELKEELLQERMVQIPELMAAHLCAYLGFFVVAAFGKKASVELQPELQKVVSSQAEYAYKGFQSHPVNLAPAERQDAQANLQALKAAAPGSIVVQTVRLGREIFDAMGELGRGRRMELGGTKQSELFCPLDSFIPLLKKNCAAHIKEWRQSSMPNPLLYAANQGAIQVGWLMGYYGHMDKSGTVKYLEYGAPCVELYIDFGEKFL